MTIRTPTSRIWAGATVALALTALVGCSSISAGTITGKEHEPRRTYFCSVKPLIFCTDDEDWRFNIADGEKDGYVYVSPETFDRYNVGDYFEENAR